MLSKERRKELRDIAQQLYDHRFDGCEVSVREAVAYGIDGNVGEDLTAEEGGFVRDCLDRLEE